MTCSGAIWETVGLQGTSRLVVLVSCPLNRGGSFLLRGLASQALRSRPVTEFLQWNS
jgi:hypothetical protein